MFPIFSSAYQQFMFKCEVRELSKHCRKPYIPRMHRAPAVFYLNHSDVWGSPHVTALSGHRYYVIFIDDFSRCTWVYLLKKI